MRQFSYLVMVSIIALVALVPIAGAQSSEQTVPTKEATSQDTQGSQQTGSTQTNSCEDPEHSTFVKEVDNKFFPLKPGTTFVYKGEEEGVPSRNTVEVTDDKKTILGVETTVVHDRVLR